MKCFRKITESLQFLTGSLPKLAPFLHLSNGKCTKLCIFTSNKISIQAKTGFKKIPLYIFPDNISLLIVSSDAKDALFTEGSFKD